MQVMEPAIHALKITSGVWWGFLCLTHKRVKNKLKYFFNYGKGVFLRINKSWIISQKINLFQREMKFINKELKIDKKNKIVFLS